MEEIWKDIKNFEGHYQVSNLGRVKSIKFSNYRIMKTKLCHGYPQVGLRLLNKPRKFMYIHRLLGIHFLDNPNNYEEINHKDGNRSNNNLTNLEWCSSSQNIKHSFDKLGKQPRWGEKCNFAKLTKNEVLKIKDLLNNTELTQKEIGKRFGVGQQQISRIKNKVRWSHL